MLKATRKVRKTHESPKTPNTSNFAIGSLFIWFQLIHLLENNADSTAIDSKYTKRGERGGLSERKSIFGVDVIKLD